ncbi:hypothetical protein CRG98_025532 [Punica granatum]|uniref:Uncharacterized protein n=1 Tax=Punica granatum TaxID=22663 RepID=A0A2I0JCS0_PUNGR|nr:hypothetical protein CRG98_025532 [Punica granatum]
MGSGAAPTPFMIKVPVREPYQDGRVPWTYKGNVESLEQQLSVMGVTRLYENPYGVPKETVPDRIEETISSIFSNNISFLYDELPSEGYAHSRAFHIVCKCNNFIVGWVMINNGSALNVCPVSTLKQMNVDLTTSLRARQSVMFQVLKILNVFSLLLGRSWIHSVDAFPSSLHQKLKFIFEDRLIMVKGEEDYAIYKGTVVPYISIGDDQSLPSHSFHTISVIRDYREVDPSHADRLVGKEISCPIEIGYKNRRGLDFRPSCHEIIQAPMGRHFHRLAAYYGWLNMGISVPPLSHFFPGPSHIIGGTFDGLSSDLDDAHVALPAIYTITEETLSRVYIHLAQENEELNNWTSVSHYSAVIADV